VQGLGAVQKLSRVRNLGGAGRRRRRRLGHRHVSSAGVEVVESRILLSTDPISEVVAGAVSNPDVDADLATQISTYSDESTDLAEGYALDVEEAYLDATQAELESEMDEFFGEAVEAVQEYDPYAGLNETPIAEYLSDYDDDLANLESSVGSESPAEDEAADNSGSDSSSVNNDGEADASGQDETDEDGSIFDYGNEISSYAEQVITETLDPTSSAEEESEDASSEESTESSEESSSSGTTGSTTTGSTTTGGTTTGGTTTGTTTGGTTTGTTTGGTTTGGTTTTLADGTSEEFVNPFVVPAGLEVSGVELPTEVTGGVDLLTVAPTSPGFFTTVVTGSVAPTVDPVNDPELGSGTKTSLAGAMLVTTQTWTSPTNWTIKHTLGSAFSSNTETTDSDGVSRGKLHTGGSTTVITISSSGTSTYSYTASDSVTTSQSNGWDDSNSTLGTIDKGGYSASYTVSSTLTFTNTDTLVTLPDGSPGRTSSVYFSLNSFNSADFGADYQLYESTGTLAAYGRDPVTQAVFRSAGGNGETLDASGGFNVYGSTDVTVWLDASATYPDGGEIQDSDITGSAGFDTTIISGGGVGQAIAFDSQSYSGAPGTESETYEYVSLSFSDSAGGNTKTTVNAEFSLDDPVPVTTAPVSVASTASLTATAPPDDGVDFSVTHNDSGGTTFSLLIDVKSPRIFYMGPNDWSRTVFTVNLEMTVTANTVMSITEGAFGEPVAGITASGKMVGSSTISIAQINRYDIDDTVPPDGLEILNDYSIWTPYTTQTMTANSTWSVQIGVSVFGTPTVSGTWNGDLTYALQTGEKYEGSTTYIDPSTQLIYVAWFETDESIVYTYIMNGAASDSGGSIGHDYKVEERDLYNGSQPFSVIEEHDVWSEGLDNVQTVLDVAGMVPVIGEAADLINVGINLGRGKWADAALSGAAMIPFAGAFATGGKFLKKAAGKVDDVGEVLAKNAGDIKKKTDDFIELPVVSSNCFIAGTQVVVASADDVTPIDIPLPEELLVEPELNDNSSTTAAFMGAGVAIALARHNRKARRHRRRILSRRLNSSE